MLYLTMSVSSEVCKVRLTIGLILIGRALFKAALRVYRAAGQIADLLPDRLTKIDYCTSGWQLMQGRQGSGVRSVRAQAKATSCVRQGQQHEHAFANQSSFHYPSLLNNGSFGNLTLSHKLLWIRQLNN